MNLLKPLCMMRWHAWETEHEVLATVYQHVNPELPPVSSTAQSYPRKQVCRRCGSMRIWSFSRGKWRKVY